MRQMKSEAICEQLLYDFDGLLSWQWDDWTETFLADFDTENEFLTRAIVEKHLPNLWDISNIHLAPREIQEVYNHLGRLRRTQFLFSSDALDKDFVFCAWWPWDNGQKISLRFAPFNKKRTNAEKDKLMRRLMVLAAL